MHQVHPLTHTAHTQCDMPQYLFVVCQKATHILSGICIHIHIHIYIYIYIHTHTHIYIYVYIHIHIHIYIHIYIYRVLSLRLSAIPLKKTVSSLKRNNTEGNNHIVVYSDSKRTATLQSEHRNIKQTGIHTYILLGSNTSCIKVFCIVERCFFPPLFNSFRLYPA